jgi:hypothetical protein
VWPCCDRASSINAGEVRPDRAPREPYACRVRQPACVTTCKRAPTTNLLCHYDYCGAVFRSILRSADGRALIGSSRMLSWPQDRMLPNACKTRRVRVYIGLQQHPLEPQPPSCCLIPTSMLAPTILCQPGTRGPEGARDPRASTDTSTCEHGHPSHVPDRTERSSRDVP